MRSAELLSTCCKHDNLVVAKTVPVLHTRRTSLTKQPKSFYFIGNFFDISIVPYMWRTCVRNYTQ